MLDLLFAGIETKFAGSSCNDLVTADSGGSSIISGHFDKRIRFWDARTDASANDIVLNGKVTSLDLSRGECTFYFFFQARSYQETFSDITITFLSFIRAGSMEYSNGSDISSSRLDLQRQTFPINVLIPQDPCYSDTPAKSLSE